MSWLNEIKESSHDHVPQARNSENNHGRQNKRDEDEVPGRTRTWSGVTSEMLFREFMDSPTKSSNF